MHLSGLIGEISRSELLIVHHLSRYEDVDVVV